MSTFKIYNATELWQRETCLPSIPSFSLSLDNVLGSDGLQLGSITELVGLPGSGKTQLWLKVLHNIRKYLLEKVREILVELLVLSQLNYGDIVYGPRLLPKTKRVGFKYAASKIWNDLPPPLQEPMSLPVFQKSLRTPINPRNTPTPALGINLTQHMLRLGPIAHLNQLQIQNDLQFCASVQIPKVLGGLSAEALYIDTNTNFSIYRFKEILFASLGKCQTLLHTNIAVQEEDALKKLHYMNAFGLEKFCACIHKLPKFVQQYPNIKLIVIDSIAFPFKEGISTKQRTGLLFRLMAELHRTALENQIAVVVTNEMSTRLGLSSGSSVGALGDAWAHCCARRLLLAARGGERVALMLKSNNAPNAVGSFKITEEGIRDVE